MPLTLASAGFGVVVVVVVVVVEVDVVVVVVDVVVEGAVELLKSLEVASGTGTRRRLVTAAGECWSLMTRAVCDSGALLCSLAEGRYNVRLMLLADGIKSDHASVCWSSIRFATVLVLMLVGAWLLTSCMDGLLGAPEPSDSQQNCVSGSHRAACLCIELLPLLLMPRDAASPIGRCVGGGHMCLYSFGTQRPLHSCSWCAVCAVALDASEASGDLRAASMFEWYMTPLFSDLS